MAEPGALDYFYGTEAEQYLALGGVGEKALLRFLSDRPNIKTVYLCLDSDQAGSDACSRLAELVPEGLTVHRLVPLYKDWNEVLQHRAEITDGKYIREAVYGLKEPPQEETVEIIHARLPLGREFFLPQSMDLHQSKNALIGRPIRITLTIIMSTNFIRTFPLNIQRIAST